ncbi:MAG: hypothetical protein HOQ21_04935 [Dermatophilaceae bacterium]|nr:hypothetical protein [Dermatophilaceae bacterium]
MSAGARTETHDVVLRLLDHQLVAPDGALLGNVDDVELVEHGTRWLVTGLMVGPAALSQRMPGRLGDWLYAVWRRLHPAEHPTPVVVPIEHVLRFDSAVHVDEPAAHALTLTFGLELWLRKHVVGRLPGAREAGGEKPSRRPVEPGAEKGREGLPPAPTRAPLDGALGLSALIGRQVRDAHGEPQGRVTELRCAGRPRGERQEPLRVESVVYSRRLLASELGYSVDRQQGPALVRRAVRTWQHRDRLVDVAQLEGVGDVDGELRLRDSARPRHPHDA